MRRQYVNFFFVVFIVININNLSSQSIREITYFGDSLFLLKENSAALNEYQRAFYFSSDFDHKAGLSKRIAECYLTLNELSLAYAYYDTALYYSTCDSGKIECKFDKILCIILEKDFRFALLKLEELETIEREYFLKKNYFYKAICNFGLEQYDDAYNNFNKSLSPTDTLLKHQLDQVFESKRKFLHPYPVLATTMSVLIPGSGQMYSGDIKDGINSFLLLYSLAYIALYTPFLDFFIIFPFFYRYYIGGIQNANESAKERKREKQFKGYDYLMTIFKEYGYLNSLFKTKPEHEHFVEYFENSVSESNILLSFSFLFYKNYLSSQDVDACVFYPSCSVYMLEAVQKKGALEGFLEGLDRLLRCHSFVNEHDYPYNLNTKKYYDAF